MAAGAEMNLSSFATSAHAGTHMDAPLHFVADGAPMDRLHFDAVIGAARVIGIRDPERITAAELETQNIRPGERLLFKTANSRRSWRREPFDTKYVAVSAGAASWLVERKPALIGVDYLSVGAYEGDGAETHRILLRAGIWVLEGLNLRSVEPGSYELICLPLSIAGAEGAPARAVLRRTE
jgi:arylformamidase